MLCDALAIAARGGRVLSIASPATRARPAHRRPAEVVAADLAPRSRVRGTTGRRLRASTIRRCTPSWVGPAADRLATYARLREALSIGAGSLLDERRAIAQGPIHAGKFEATPGLPRACSRSSTDTGRLGAASTEVARRAERFYDRRWDTWRWRLLFRAFLDRTVMGRLGRDPHSSPTRGPGERRISRGPLCAHEGARRIEPLSRLHPHGTSRPRRCRYLRPEHAARSAPARPAARRVRRVETRARATDASTSRISSST